jgi:hypothetical protein
MEVALREIDGTDMPFNVRLLPLKFPPLAELKLWVYPDAEPKSSFFRDDSDENPMRQHDGNN